MRLLECHEHEDQIGEAAGTGDEEERRQGCSESQHRCREQRADDVARPDHEAHEAVALRPQARAHEVGDHGVAGREEERPAEAAIDEDEQQQRPEAMREGEAEVSDRLAGGAAEHHRAPSVAVAEAAGERLQRQTDERRPTHDEADRRQREMQAALEQDRRVGESEADRDEVQECPGDEQPEAAWEEAELAGEAVKPGMP